MSDDSDDAGGPFDGVEDADSGTDPVTDVPSTGDDALWYPTVDDIVEVHDDIIAEDPDGEPGVADRDRIQYALDHIRHGHFDRGPDTLHEKAFALLRLIASNHWFIDGNKRTALNVTNLFYLLNGCELQYGEELRAMLKLLAVKESLINRETATEYLKDRTTELDEETIRTLGLAALGSLLMEELGVAPSALDAVNDGPDSSG